MSEPVQVYAPEDGTCNTSGCLEIAEYALTLRSAPLHAFPDGLLTRTNYCAEDAVWFLWAHTNPDRGYGSTFVSLERVAR